jgi:hypothetical protein
MASPCKVRRRSRIQAIHNSANLLLRRAIGPFTGSHTDFPLK